MYIYLINIYAQMMAQLTCQHVNKGFHNPIHHFERVIDDCQHYSHAIYIYVNIYIYIQPFARTISTTRIHPFSSFRVVTLATWTSDVTGKSARMASALPMATIGWATSTFTASPSRATKASRLCLPMEAVFSGHSTVRFESPGRATVSSSHSVPSPAAGVSRCAKNPLLPRVPVWE